MGESTVEPNLTTNKNSPHQPNTQGLANGLSSRPENSDPSNGENTPGGPPAPIPAQSTPSRLTIATKTRPVHLPSPPDSALPSPLERESQEANNAEHAANHGPDTDSEDDNVPLINFVPWYYRYPFPPPKSGSPVLRVQQLASRQTSLPPASMRPYSWLHTPAQHSDSRSDLSTPTCNSSTEGDHTSDEDTDGEADHDPGLDHTSSHPMAVGPSPLNSTQSFNEGEDNLITTDSIPNVNPFRHLTVSPNESVSNESISRITSQSTPFRRPLPATLSDPAVHLTSSHSSTVSTPLSEAQSSTLRQQPTLPLNSTARWNRPIIKQDFRHYRRNISRYHQDDTLPPPPYSVDQLQVSTLNLNTSNEGDRILPPYVCTLQKEGPMYMKMEFWDDHTRAKHRIWRMRYFQLWGTCLRIYEHKPKDYKDTSHLLLSFGTQDLHSGLALEYRKRPYVFRVRVDGFQFLVQAKSAQEMVYWIDALHASANIALPIEERHIPRFTPLTHRHRHHH